MVNDSERTWKTVKSKKCFEMELTWQSANTSSSVLKSLNIIYLISWTTNYRRVFPL